MVALCVTAVVAALAGLLSVGLTLGGVALALLSAPVFGAVSLCTGVAAAVLALRRDTAPIVG